MLEPDCAEQGLRLLLLYITGTDPCASLLCWGLKKERVHWCTHAACVIHARIYSCVQIRVNEC